VWTSEANGAFVDLKRALTEAPSSATPTQMMLSYWTQMPAIMQLVLFSHSCKRGKSVQWLITAKCWAVQSINTAPSGKLLAVVKAVKHFHPYLYGRSFVLRTDHAALRWLLSFRVPEGQIARWLERLQQYNFWVEHRPGHRHDNADAISRRPCINTGCKHCDRMVTKEKLQRKVEEQPNLKVAAASVIPAQVLSMDH